MGYNVPKAPFNLAEFLSEKAPRRPVKRRMPFAYRRGSTVQETAPDTEDLADAKPEQALPT